MKDMMNKAVLNKSYPQERHLDVFEVIQCSNGQENKGIRSGLEMLTPGIKSVDT